MTDILTQRRESRYQSPFETAVESLDGFARSLGSAYEPGDTLVCTEPGEAEVSAEALTRVKLGDPDDPERQVSVIKQASGVQEIGIQSIGGEARHFSIRGRVAVADDAHAADPSMRLVDAEQWMQDTLRGLQDLAVNPDLFHIERAEFNAA